MKDTFTMVVIDDIKTVVSGIVRMDWKTHGIEIVGTAFDGESGLSLLKEACPDIVVTDIRMPKLSGIEMTRDILELLPKGKFIFISGYSDFENARQAIKLGAFDYLLKPFTSAQLLQIVLKARDAVGAERLRNERYAAMEGKLRESMPLLKQEYLNMMVRYASDLRTIEERWGFLDIDMEECSFAVLVMEIDHLHAQDEILTVWQMELNRFSVQNVVEETLSGLSKGVVFRDGVSRFVCIMNASDEEQPVETAEQFVENVSRFSTCTISVGVGTVVQKKDEILKSYRQALEALSYNFYTGGNSVFDFRNIVRNQRGLTLKRHPEEEKELFYAIRSGNADKAVQLLGQIYAGWEDLQRGYPNPEQFKMLYVELAMDIQEVVRDFLLEAEKPPFKESIRELAYKSYSVRDLQQFLNELVLTSCGFILKEQKELAQIIIDRSIQYIKERLHMNLSVGDYAKQAHLSPSYYANLFKKTTGMSVMQFVVNEKMSKAKELLAGKHAIHEAAEALGYEDRSYFSEVFKKHTGITPKEFKARYSAK